MPFIFPQKATEKIKLLFNLFETTGLFLYNLKTSEKLWFTDVFQEYKKKPVA